MFSIMLTRHTTHDYVHYENILFWPKTKPTTLGFFVQKLGRTFGKPGVLVMQDLEQKQNQDEKRNRNQKQKKTRKPSF